MKFFFTYKPLDGEDRKLSLGLELDADGNYTILDGKISLKDGNGKWGDTPITPDDFSEKLGEFAFDENDVRFEIEDAIFASQKEEIV